MFVAGFGLCLFVRVTVLREECRWGVREFHDLVFGDNFVPTGSLLDSERTSLMVREKYPYSYPTSPYSLLDY